MNTANRKLKKKSGFTLIEMLVTIVILVIMVVAIGDGMSAATRIYKESVFFSNSSSLASMLNTTFEDLFRYSEQIYLRNEGGDYVSSDGHVISGTSVTDTPAVLFSNAEYGAQNAYVYLSEEAGTSPVRIRNVFGGQVRDLLNTGAYPKLMITNLQITYDGPVYTIAYVIQSTEDAALTKSVEMKVRLLNQFQQ